MEVAGDVAWSRFHNHTVFSTNGADTKFHWIDSAVLLGAERGTDVTGCRRPGRVLITRSRKRAAASVSARSAGQPASPPQALDECALGHRPLFVWLLAPVARRLLGRVGKTAPPVGERTSATFGFRTLD